MKIIWNYNYQSSPPTTSTELRRDRLRPALVGFRLLVGGEKPHRHRHAWCRSAGPRRVDAVLPARQENDGEETAMTVEERGRR